MLQGRIQPVPVHDLTEAALSHFHGGELGSQVAVPLLGSAGVAADEPDHLAVYPPPAHQPDGRDDGALLVELGGQGEGPRCHAPHVGVVAPVGHESRQFPGASAFIHRRGGRGGRGHKDRRHHGDVGKMAPAQIGVVEHDHVPRAEGAAVGLHGGADGGGHGTQVDGHVGRLGHHLALGVEEGAGEVPALLDVGRVGGALKGHAHLLAHGYVQVLEDLQADGINHRLPPVGWLLHGFPSAPPNRRLCPARRPYFARRPPSPQG